MAFINWSKEKNEFLKEHRGVSFEMVEEIIKIAGLNNIELKIIDHPNYIKYPHQKILLAEIDDYI